MREAGGSKERRFKRDIPMRKESDLLIAMLENAGVDRSVGVPAEEDLDVTYMSPTPCR